VIGLVFAPGKNMIVIMVMNFQSQVYLPRGLGSLVQYAVMAQAKVKLIDCCSEVVRRAKGYKYYCKWKELEARGEVGQQR